MYLLPVLGENCLVHLQTLCSCAGIPQCVGDWNANVYVNRGDDPFTFNINFDGLLSSISGVKHGSAVYSRHR